MTKITTILFDFDGVLIDSFDLAYQVASYIRPSLTKKKYASKWVTNIADADHSEPVVNDVSFDEEYDRRHESIDIHSTGQEIVPRLAERYRIFIVSSTINRTINSWLDRVGLNDYVDGVYGWDIETSKVKKFQMILGQYELEPDECLFVTDTAGDIHEAKEVAIGTIVGITGGYQEKKYLTKAKPHFIIDDLREVFDIIKQVEKSKSAAGAHE